MNKKVYNAVDKPTELEKHEIVNFLHEHLEQYGDAKQDIKRALDYAVKDTSSFGGFILIAHEGDSIRGAVVINRTGMEGYIPPNILVYIAIHKENRGKGLGKDLLDYTINYAKGDIALHVEKDNPARFLYKKVGFATPYLEKRLKK